MMITVKLRCDYIQELSGGVRDADGCGAGREEGGEAEKGKGAMFSLRSNISCEEGSTSWAGGERRGGEGSRGGVMKSVHS